MQVYLRAKDTVWRSDVQVSDSSTASTSPSIALDGDGNVHVLWEEGGNVKSRSFFGNWTSVQNVSDGGERPLVLYDESGGIGVLYGNATLKLKKGFVGVVEVSVDDTDFDGISDSVELGFVNQSYPELNDGDGGNTTTNASNFDSDGDGLPDGWVDGWTRLANGSWGLDPTKRDGVAQAWEGEDVNLNGVLDVNETDPNSNDSDGDGMPDGWEAWNGLNPTSAAGENGASGDKDNDGLSNLAEYQAGTDPRNPDSDGDGLTDAIEIAHNSNATNPDSDGDGMPDGKEYLPWTDSNLDGVANILDNDSDNDGLADGAEVNPLSDSDGDGRPNVIDWDSDGDNVSDGKEVNYNLDSDVDGKVNVLDADSDNDGLSDGFEDADRDGVVDRYETSPINPDSDGDGVWDGYNITVDGVFHPGEKSYGTDPLDKDSDDDVLYDGDEVREFTLTVKYANGTVVSVNVSSNPFVSDSDGEGVSDRIEYQFSDPQNNDSDSDGLTDFEEDSSRNGVTDGNESSPTNADSDGDGLGDYYEIMVSHTLPSNADSDGDGLLDYEGRKVIFRTNASDFDPPLSRSDVHYSGRILDLYCKPRTVSSVTLLTTWDVFNRTITQVYSFPPASGQYYYYGPVNVNMVTLGDALNANQKVCFNYTAYGSYYTNECHEGPGVNYTLNVPVGVPSAAQVNSSWIMNIMENITTFTEVTGTLGLNQYQVDYATAKITLNQTFSGNASHYLNVSYVCAPVIDYADARNNASWIALQIVGDTLSPLGRVDGKYYTDDEITKRTPTLKGATPEGYSIFSMSNYYNPQGDVDPTIYDISYRSDGEVALLIGREGNIFLFNRTAKTLTSVSSGVSSDLYGVDFRPNRSEALIVGAGGTLLYYNGTNVTALSSGTGGSLRDVAWKPDGSLALAVGGDGNGMGVALVYYANGTTVSLATGVTDLMISRYLNGVAWHPGGSYAIVVGDWRTASRSYASADAVNVNGSVMPVNCSITYTLPAVLRFEGGALTQVDKPEIRYYNNLPHGRIECFPRLNNLLMYLNGIMYARDGSLALITGRGTRREYTTSYNYDEADMSYMLEYATGFKLYSEEGTTRFTRISSSPDGAIILFVGGNSTYRYQSNDWGVVYVAPLVGSTYLNAVELNPNRNFTEGLIAGDHFVSGGHITSVVYYDRTPYVIDVPGDGNPAYDYAFATQLASEAACAETSVSLRQEYANNYQEVYDPTLATNPLLYDTDGDFLGDGDELSVLRLRRRLPAWEQLQVG